MKFIVVTTLAALARESSANVLMGAGPKLARRLNFAKVISPSPRSRFNAEGHSGSLDLCAEDAPFSGPGHTSHDHDECMASTCDMWKRTRRNCMRPRRGSRHATMRRSKPCRATLLQLTLDHVMLPLHTNRRAVPLRVK